MRKHLQIGQSQNETEKALDKVVSNDHILILSRIDLWNHLLLKCNQILNLFLALAEPNVFYSQIW